VKILASMFFVTVAIVAQAEVTMVARVEAMVFPPLPRMARIQGDVRLRSGPEGVTLFSGHPLLAPAAVDTRCIVPSGLRTLSWLDGGNEAQ